METIINQIRAVMIIIREMVKMIIFGVELLITRVKRLRKNKVTLGFSTFVKNPILNAWKRVRSGPADASFSSNLESFASIEAIPI